MPRYRLDISYDGAAFHGWQSQPSGKAVQDHLERALRIITREHCLVYGSSRTDAGVHALSQVAHVDIPTAPRHHGAHRATSLRFAGASGLINRINALVRPYPLQINRVQQVKPEFHARFDAKKRLYRYFMAVSVKDRTTDQTVLVDNISHDHHQSHGYQHHGYQHRGCQHHENRKHQHQHDSTGAIADAVPLFWGGRAWFLPLYTDEISRMISAAPLFQGHHNFSGFRSSQCQAPRPWRTLDKVSVTILPHYQNALFPIDGFSPYTEKKYNDKAGTHTSTSAPTSAPTRVPTTSPIDHDLTFSLTNQSIIMVMIEFQSQAFLHRQVRKIVGTLVDVARGRCHESDIMHALACGLPIQHVSPAPAHGLFLHSVSYDETHSFL